MGCGGIPWMGGFCFGLRPPSAEGLAWPAPLSRPHRPPTFLGTGGLPLHLPAEHWVPCTLLRETGEAFAQHCGGLAEPPAEAAPPAPCLGTEVRQCFSPSASGCFLARGREIGTPILTCPRTRRQGQRRPGGGVGMGPLRSAIQGGQAARDIAHQATVIAPTAVRPRCDGLFPAGAAVHTKPARAAFLPSLRQVAGVEGPDLDQPSVHRVVPPLEGGLGGWYSDAAR